VPFDADSKQIRAAYVALLKRYHPDQANAREALENAPQIQRIIAAYRTLKDPVSRTRYDATLRPVTRPSPPPRNPNPGLPFAWDFRRASARFKLEPQMIPYAFMLMVAALGLYLLVSRLIQEPRPGRAMLPLASSVREIAARTQLESAVRNAGTMSRAEASNFSSRCFAAARHGRDPVATDTCIAFDMAYVYWRDAVGGPLATDPYFQADAMDSRFRSALGPLNPAKVAARIRSVRAATLKAVMETPRPTDDFGFSFSERQAVTGTSSAKKGNQEAPSRE
jgi:curved DNA-binding protein CbpA